MPNRPLILLTNDDGVESPGLRAAAQAVAGLGDLLIVAPSTQRSGTGRGHLPVLDHAIYTTQILLNDNYHIAYKAEVTPAQAVMIGVIELAERPIDLCISGVNYGENIGTSVTISGTIGAAIEAATFNIPTLAVSIETAKEYHRNHSEEVDFSVAMHFTRYFAQQTLAKGLPQDVDILKIDIPDSATPDTPWRAATVSRQRYYDPVPSGRKQLEEQKMMDYQVQINYDTLEPDSDIHIFYVERLVAVSPMKIDLTAPVPLDNISRFFNGEL